MDLKGRRNNVRKSRPMANFPAGKLTGDTFLQATRLDKVVSRRTTAFVTCSIRGTISMKAWVGRTRVLKEEKQKGKGG